MEPTYVVGGLLIVALLLAVVVRFARRGSAAEDRKNNPPILVFSAKARGAATFADALPEPLPRTRNDTVEALAPLPESASPYRESPPAVWPGAAAAYASAAPPAAVPPRPHEPVRAAPPRTESRPPAVREIVAAGAGPRLVGTPVRAEPQAIPSPVEALEDGTLQLLPGRIRILSANGENQEIRFVRVPGTPPEVTFGRSTGPAHRHVQLESPTVSRLHARLRFEDDGWILSNLSRTNPTRLNGQPLAGERAELPVRDGDRIEMGDVTLEFNQPETQERLPFRSSWASEIGLRSTNQDAVAVRTLTGRRELAAVCDGVGSHRAGARASHTAIEAVVRALSTVSTDLTAAIRAANDAVRREAKADPSAKGMGTTMVALLREGERYWVGNVGDSRCYRVDAAGIRQITSDHSFIAEAMRSGEMSRDEAERSPWRNAITRNLGAEADVEVDVFGEFSAAEPHVVVLCTDGLHGVLATEDIERTVRQTTDIRDLARVLCDEAIRRGSKDNVSVAAMAFAGGITGARPGSR